MRPILYNNYSILANMALVALLPREFNSTELQKYSFRDSNIFYTWSQG